MTATYRDIVAENAALRALLRDLVETGELVMREIPLGDGDWDNEWRCIFCGAHDDRQHTDGCVLARARRLLAGGA